jgi:hydroxypyruvate reductase
VSLVIRAALAAVDAGGLVQRALIDASLVSPLQTADAVDVIAAGKAARAMLNAFAATSAVPVRHVLGIGPDVSPLVPAGTEWITGGHPYPTAGSVAGGQRAYEIAAASRPGELLVVLLSGGGSALMALPAEGLTLDDKQRTARLLMERGADIFELNTVRKHLSGIKGGQLAAAAQGKVLTLIVSDVVGDDLSVIASGPTVPDASTFDDAIRILDRRGGRDHYPSGVVTRLERGARGDVRETPKPGARLDHAYARVIGPQRGALEGARAAATALGYHVHLLEEPVTGEARIAALEYIDTVTRRAASLPRPACVISAGETTVTVVGHGRGGRNQEFALAMAERLAQTGQSVVAASVGTDGIDGPTDAAGAIVDTTTLERATAVGAGPPAAYLARNDAYHFFDAIGDLIRTGATDTNVGDLQVVLVGPGEESGMGQDT